MKKLLSLLAFVLIGAYAFGQCTPDTSLTIPAGETSAFEPDSATGIPCALVGQNYSTQVDFIIPDQIDFGGALVDLDSIRLLSVSGPPNEFGFECGVVVPPCTWPSLSPGCVTFFSPNPQNVGTYPLTINVEAKVVIGAISLWQPESETSYTLRVFATQVEIDSNADCQRALTTTGIYERELPGGVDRLYNTPNPFQGATEIKFTADNPAQYTFQVHNLMGEIIYEREVQAGRGQNTVEFDGSQLDSGVYFYNITDGNKSLTTRMVKM